MTATRHVLAQLAVMVAAGGVAGCSANRAAEATPAGGNAAARRASAEVVFNQATLHKPSPESSPDALELAPILVEETCAVGTVPTGASRIVYAGAMTAELHGVQYPQWVYIWTYPDAPGWGWLRVTLDSLGYPVIWETLTDAGPPVEIYAAQSLEDRAVRQFGSTMHQPVPALTAVTATPAARLVRILNDGPVPMGPMVYVDRDHRLPTVICRCMPAQVLNVDVTATYEIAPAETQPGSRVGPEADSAFLPEGFLEAWPAGNSPADPRFLEGSLRLPPGF